MITIARRQGVLGDVRVNFTTISDSAVSESDYQYRNDSILLLSGQTRQNVAIKILQVPQHKIRRR